MVKLEDPYEKREQEWNYFMVPHSLREKLERADLTELTRKYRAYIDDYLPKLREWEEKSRESDTIVVKSRVAA